MEVEAGDLSVRQEVQLVLAGANLCRRGEEGIEEGDPKHVTFPLIEQFQAQLRDVFSKGQGEGHKHCGIPGFYTS